MNAPRVPESDPLLSPPRRSPKGESFGSRLGVYLIGVALGLMIVGLIWQNRQRERAQRQAEWANTQPPRAAPAPSPPSAPQ